MHSISRGLALFGAAPRRMAGGVPACGTCEPASSRKPPYASVQNLPMLLDRRTAILGRGGHPPTAREEDMTRSNPWLVWFDEVGLDDVALVGGKNASLGEMRRALVPMGIRVPDGFATTAEAYRAFLRSEGLEGLIDR